MNRDLRNKINDFADIVRDEFNISTPIQDMKEIVERIGGSIEETEVLPRLADGRLKRYGDSFIITVPKSQPEVRKRFSIAHELGHLFLHMGFMIDKEIWEENKNDEYFREDDGELEFQAHEFASALLMPKKEFLDKMASSYMGNNKYDMNSVASYFNVPLEAAINRGRWLNLLSWG